MGRSWEQVSMISSRSWVLQRKSFQLIVQGGTGDIRERQDTIRQSSISCGFVYQNTQAVSIRLDPMRSLEP